MTSLSPKAKSSRILQLFLCLVLLPQSVDCQGSNRNKNRWNCDLTGEPAIELNWYAEKYHFEADPSLETNPYNTNTTGGGRIRQLSESYNDQNSFLRGGDKLVVHEAAYRAFSSRSLQGNTTFDATQASTRPWNANNTPVVVVARRCHCFDSSVEQPATGFYCDISLSHCAYRPEWVDNPSSPSGKSYTHRDPTCFNVEVKESFARNLWPIVTVWLLVVTLSLFLTKMGHHALGHCISKVYPCWNVRSTDRFIALNPEYADRAVWRDIAAEAAANAGNPTRINHNGYELTLELTGLSASESRTQEFLLRTKKFRYGKKGEDENGTGSIHSDVDYPSVSEAPSNGDEPNPSDFTAVEKESGEADSRHDEGSSSGDDGNQYLTDDDDSLAPISCTICHIYFEEGDSVGNLPCGHTFHTKCLKSWIARRNVCPLCLAENIATRRPPPTDASSNQTAGIPDSVAPAEIGPVNSPVAALAGEQPSPVPGSTH